MARWIWAAVLAGALVVPMQSEAAARKGRMTRIEQRELDQLQQQLRQLEKEYARKEAELEVLQLKGGTGGSGVGGSGMPLAPVGILYEGTVAEISTRARELNLKDPQGRVLVFPITGKTRAYRNGQRVGIDTIRKGTPVRVSMDLVNDANHGRRPIREILIDSAK